MWLGLAKYSKEATNSLPDEFLPVFEEEDEEQRKLVPVGLRKLPIALSCQGEEAHCIQATRRPFSAPLKEQISPHRQPLLPAAMSPVPGPRPDGGGGQRFVQSFR